MKFRCLPSILNPADVRRMFVKLTFFEVSNGKKSLLIDKKTLSLYLICASLRHCLLGASHLFVNQSDKSFK